MEDLMEQQVRLTHWHLLHFGTEQGEGEQLKKSPCMYVFVGGNGDYESIKCSDSLGRIGK